MTGNENKIRRTEIIGGQKAQEKVQAIKQEIEEILAIKVDSPIINMEWMEGRSEEELLDLILAATRVLKKKKATTEKITRGEDPITFREYSEIAPSDFMTAPLSAEAKADSDSKAWFIVLVSYDASHKPLALKLLDDVIIGRAVEEVVPDVDLTDFDTEKHGISREHAKIRVTSDQLLLADLGSTNGTFFYEERLVLGKSAVITDQSVISFGKLHFKVIIVRRPGEKK